MKTVTKLSMLMILGLWLMYLLFADKKTNTNTNINLITQEPRLGSNHAAIQPELKQYSPPQITPVKHEVKVSAFESNSPSSLSYMTLYRWSRTWRTCKNIKDYQQQDQWFDASQYLISKMQQNGTLTPNLPTSTQIEALQSHASECLEIQSKLAKIDIPPSNQILGPVLSEPFHTTKHVMQLLRTYKTTTEKGSKLKQVIDLSHQWVQLFQAVIEVSKGNESTNEVHIEIIIDELKQLRMKQAMMHSKVSSAENKEQHMSDYMALYMSIEKNKKDLQDLMVIDEAERSQALADFSVINKQLFEFLQSPDPDIFYEAHVTLEQNNTLSYFNFSPHKNLGMRALKRPFIEYVFPEQIIMDTLGLNNPDWFNHLIPYAMQMYLCELGADCGIDSEWGKYHCFQSYTGFNTTSCELDLLSFYQDQLLSPNQHEDVQTVLSAVRDLYAH